MTLGYIRRSFAYLGRMQTDALHRRIRFAKPQPKHKRIVVHSGDISVFEALHRHGPLPIHYLHEFARCLTKNRNAFQHRLTKLYNGAQESSALLSRPRQQFASFNARFQPMIYDLTELSRAVLKEHGKLNRYAPERADHFLHRFMAACVSASIELAAAASGLRYISKEEIFVRAPEKTKQTPNPLAIPISSGRSLVPDDLFALRYPDNRVRFFAVEIDRNTESVERKCAMQNSYANKLDGYLDIFAKRTYQAHWSVPNLVLLTVTTSTRHLKNIIDHLLTKSDLTDRFLFKAKPEFGTNWRVPELMADLVVDPWVRANDEIRITE